MIERLLPHGVYSASARFDDPAGDLFPEEAALMRGAAAGRRAEFATARQCAHIALARLGVAPAPILRGAKHEPLWPQGVVGSITHCRGYRAAAVALAKNIAAVGIDAEPAEQLPQSVERRVLRDEERSWLVTAPPGIPWGRLIFSAKEAIYKAWFPLTHRWLGFEDATVVIHPEAGMFHVRVLVDGPACFREFAGRYLVEDGVVVTAIALHA